MFTALSVLEWSLAYSWNFINNCPSERTKAAKEKANLAGNPVMSDTPWLRLGCFHTGQTCAGFLLLCNKHTSNIYMQFHGVPGPQVDPASALMNYILK